MKTTHLHSVVLWASCCVHRCLLILFELFCSCKSCYDIVYLEVFAQMLVFCWQRARWILYTWFTNFNYCNRILFHIHFFFATLSSQVFRPAFRGARDGTERTLYCTLRGGGSYVWCCARSNKQRFISSLGNGDCSIWQAILIINSESSFTSPNLPFCILFSFQTSIKTSKETPCSLYNGLASQAEPRFNADPPSAA